MEISARHSTSDFGLNVPQTTQDDTGNGGVGSYVEISSDILDDSQGEIVDGKVCIYSRLGEIVGFNQLRRS